ncbi:MAG: 3-phosphoserine/phosphohydroxythreonine transaminase [Gammaproteobacteria bacterium]|nr:3-phosphoserine/phosphohydroxythreonine transaminase [Gammaproteobacteria bacterium]MYC26214.1 3-phosphoserine/phosphohydroxythreonine transaminase [Gammaproteobacteria bacterium]
MRRAHNFSAGPAALPAEVMTEIQHDLLDYRGTGMSVMEISHRSSTFMDIASRAEHSLRQLLRIGEDYHVLFLQGGARLQFTMIPLNLAEPGEVVEYVDTGIWSQKALKEAERLRDAKTVASAHDHIPAESTWTRYSGSKYLYITSNETISGVQYHDFPSVDSVPLVVDASSDFLTRPMEVERFGLIYACAQKNFGPSGLAIVIVRKNLCREALEQESEYLNYATHAKNTSMFNTPNTFAWYIAGLMFDWISAQGGVKEMQKQSELKSQRLYDLLDGSALYRSVIEPRFRSSVSVTFTLADDSLNGRLLVEAENAGIHHLKGHRAVGGFRASLYNGVPMQAVDALVEFLADFELRKS